MVSTPVECVVVRLHRGILLELLDIIYRDDLKEFGFGDQVLKMWSHLLFEEQPLVEVCLQVFPVAAPREPIEIVGTEVAALVLPVKVIVVEPTPTLKPIECFPCDATPGFALSVIHAFAKMGPKDG